MKVLLRSTFVVDPQDHKDLLFKNYQALYESGLTFELIQDSVIWNFVQDFCQVHLHVPDVKTIRSHFHHLGETEVLDRVDVLVAIPSCTRGDFISRLEEKAHDRRVREVIEILKEAATITQKGIEIQEGKERRILKGPITAVKYIMDKSHDIVTPTVGARLQGDVTSDGDDFMKNYELVKADPRAGLGQMSGIQQMDVALSGAKKKELWIHAGFAGSLKSTLALNWAYTQSVYYGETVFYMSLEMHYEQVRRIFYAMHSIHEKFRDARMSLGLQTDPEVSTGLPYRAIRDGRLHEWHPNGERFLKEWVVPDFNDPEQDYGHIEVQVADPDKHDFTVHDLRAKTELYHAGTPLALIIVDHVGLMSPRKWVASTTDRQNEIIRDLKRLSQSFNRGEGVAVIALFQISRDGYRQALKAKEKTGIPRYNLTALSYANEAERSGDVITSGFTDDELRSRNKVILQDLKARDDNPFDICMARVEYGCRRIFTDFERPMTTEEREDLAKSIEDDEDIDIDAIIP